MNNKLEKLDDIKEIRALMERSSLFLSLSGIAGIIVGILAFLGVTAVYVFLGVSPTAPGYYELYIDGSADERRSFYVFLFSDFTLVLILSLCIGVLFAAQKAQKQKLPIWDATAKRLLVNMFIPLVAGGLFCLILFYHGNLALIAPCTLIFYGLALLNASKYTINDIRNLGLIELLTGLVAALFIDYGMLLWLFGFGILHIVYGTTIYFKYER